jgi:hypothetical protein
MNLGSSPTSERAGLAEIWELQKFKLSLAKKFVPAYVESFCLNADASASGAAVQIRTDCHGRMNA